MLAVAQYAPYSLSLLVSRLACTIRSAISSFFSLSVVLLFNARSSDAAYIDSRMLGKRFDDSRFTFYDISVGQVACGGLHQDSEFVSASRNFWRSGKHN